MVRSAFTRKGWDKVVRERLESPLQNADLWVLSRTPRTPRTRRSSAIKKLASLYFEQYITEWQTFLDTIEVARPGSNAEVLAELEEFTRGKPPPLARLFQALGLQHQAAQQERRRGAGRGPAREDQGEARQGASKSAREVADIGGSFVPGPRRPERSQYTALARAGRVRLAGEVRRAAEARHGRRAARVRAAGSVPGAAGVRPGRAAPVRGEPLREQGAHDARLATAKVTIQSLINGQEDPNIRPFLNKLLMPPLEAASAPSSGEAGGEINQSWCSEVSDPSSATCSTATRSTRRGTTRRCRTWRSSTGRQRHGVGLLRRLAQGERAQGGRHVTSRSAGWGASSFQPALFNFLTRSDDITTSLFSPKGPEPGVQFTIHIRPSPQLASITFSVDGKSVEYKNGPEEWYQFTWPGDGKKSGAFIKVAQQPRPGGDARSGWRVGPVPADGGRRAAGGQGRARVLGDVEDAVRGRGRGHRLPPARTATPFFGTSPGPDTGMLQPFRAPGVAPPRTIGRGAGCSG